MQPIEKEIAPIYRSVDNKRSILYRKMSRKKKPASHLRLHENVRAAAIWGQCHHSYAKRSIIFIFYMYNIVGDTFSDSRSVFSHSDHVWFANGSQNENCSFPLNGSRLELYMRTASLGLDCYLLSQLVLLSSRQDRTTEHTRVVHFPARQPSGQYGIWWKIAYSMCK